LCASKQKKLADEKEQKYIDEISNLKSEIAMYKRMIFGPKSEKFISTVDPNQGKLFDESEIMSELATEQDKTQTITVETHTKKKPKRQTLDISIPDSIERVEEIIEPEDKQNNFIKIGQEVTEVLEVEPARVYVRRIIRPKYATPEQTIVIATMIDMVLPKSNAGSSILVKLVIDKFVDHLPFHRQLKIYKREGIKIPESTYNGWFSQISKLLSPLYECLIKQISDTDYLKADESPIPVQTKDKKGATHQGYQWVYQDPIKNIVAFQYHKSRSKEAPDIMLKNFRGALQTDGYSSYEHFEKQGKVKLLGCMAHGRRYFEKALKDDKIRAEFVMAKIQKLYAIERDAKDQKLNFDEVYKLRQEQSVPILNELHAYLRKEKDKVVPKSDIGKAISYNLNQWHKLIRYTENGKYDIDNNTIENKIRPLALGRKNYMFAGSHDAAQRIAMMYSFLGTCAMNDINPSKWLKFVLENIASHKANKLYQLIPNQENFPDLGM
jgi:transposase